MKDQKSRLVLFIATLLKENKIDERLFGPVRIKGEDDPSFVINFVNSLAKPLGLEIKIDPSEK